jgi:hypothetical protein
MLMRVRDHLVVSTAGAALLAHWAGRAALGLWVGSVLIDADHYVWFCVSHRTVSTRRAIRFFNGAHPPQHAGTRALHSPGALALAGGLALRRPRLRPVVAGMGLHVLLDLGHEAGMQRARDAALRRDGFACQACGTRAGDVGTHLWHQPRLMPSYAARNLVSLCPSCHELAHRRVAGELSWR